MLIIKIVSKLFKRILKTAYYIVIAIIAIVAIFLVLSVFPVKGGYKTFIVLSGSMEPKIHTGSVVAVKAQSEYQIGDVVTFGENTKERKPTTHRIIEISDSGEKKAYVTKGDANNSVDQNQVKEDEILGKVFLSIPFIGYVVAEAQKPIGFMLIIVVPAVIIIYDELLSIKKEVLKKLDYKKRMKKRKEKEREGDSEKEEENKDNKDEKKEV